MSKIIDVDLEIRRVLPDFKKRGVKRGPFYRSVSSYNIYQSAVWQGYLDASRRFTGLSRIPNHDVIVKDILVNVSKNCIANDLKDYFINGITISFDDFHRDLCYKLINYFNSHSYSITYGLAQKIINMAFKYLYVYGIGDPNYPEIVISKFEQCLCPIDSVIMGKLLNDPIANPIIVSNGCLKLFTYISKSEHGGWSGLNEVNYCSIQKIINEFAKALTSTRPISNLEIDILYW